MQLPPHYLAKQADEKKLRDLQNERGQAWVSPEDPLSFTKQHLALIGIEQTTIPLGKGFIKLHQRDFLVEEIALEGRVVSMSPEGDGVAPESNLKPKVGADLIKQGWATFEALEILALNLNIPVTTIGYAGLKDSRAITAQEISISNLTPKDLEGRSFPRMYLKNIRERIGVLDPGKLQGNRFTIYVRANRVERSLLQERVNHLAQQGFLNFFSLQRFGNRLLAPEIGKNVYQGNYQEAVHLFLTGQSKHESQVLQWARSEAEKQWGNWSEMMNAYMIFPYFFQHEIKILQYLTGNSEDFSGALTTVQNQTSIMTKAYDSLYFNKLLSRYAQNGTVPESLPILINDPEVLKEYSRVVPAEELASIRFFHKSLPFLRPPKKNRIRTRVVPTIHAVAPVEHGYVFHFNLDKGAYATSFLAEMFDLYRGHPVPEWVNKDPLDSRQILGLPPISLTEEKLPPLEDYGGEMD